MTMNFDKYKVDFEFPDYPRKPYNPSLKKGATADQIRQYADELEIYNKRIALYREAQYRYAAKSNELNELFFNDAFFELGIDENHPKIDRLKSMAMEHGSAGGHSEIFYWLEELSQLL